MRHRVAPHLPMTDVPSRVLVSGGNGFVGQAVTRQLVAVGRQVCVVDNLRSGDPRFGGVELGLGRTSRARSARGTRALARAVAAFAPDAVIHLAAVHFIPECEADPAQAVRTNVVGSVNLLQACPAGIPFVLASSAAVYAPALGPHVESDSPVVPEDVYGFTKLHAEQWLRYFASRRSLRAVVARLTNVLGPGETNPHVLPDIIGQLKAGKPPHRDRESGVSTRLSRCRRRRPGVGAPGRSRRRGARTTDTFNIASGSSHSVAELLDLLRSVPGVPEFESPCRRRPPQTGRPARSAARRHQSPGAGVGSRRRPWPRRSAGPGRPLTSEAASPEVRGDRCQSRPVRVLAVHRRPAPLGRERSGHGGHPTERGPGREPLRGRRRADGRRRRRGLCREGQGHPATVDQPALLQPWDPAQPVSNPPVPRPGGPAHPSGRLRPGPHPQPDADPPDGAGGAGCTSHRGPLRGVHPRDRGGDRRTERVLAQRPPPANGLAPHGRSPASAGSFGGRPASSPSRPPTSRFSRTLGGLRNRRCRSFPNALAESFVRPVSDDEIDAVLRRIGLEGRDAALPVCFFLGNHANTKGIDVLLEATGRVGCPMALDRGRRATRLSRL